MNYASWVHADFFVTTNLKETRIFKIVKGEIPDRLEEVVDIPDAVKANNQKEIKKKEMHCSKNTQLKTGIT